MIFFYHLSPVLFLKLSHDVLWKGSLSHTTWAQAVWASYICLATHYIDKYFYMWFHYGVLRFHHVAMCQHYKSSREYRLWKSKHVHDIVLCLGHGKEKGKLLLLKIFDVKKLIVVEKFYKYITPSQGIGHKSIHAPNTH